MTTKKFDDEAIEKFILTLKTGHPWVKQTAAYHLGTSGDSRALNALIEALDDEDMHVRERVASALGDFGDPQAFEALIRHLNESETHYNLQRIMWAIAKLKPQEAIPYLIPYLQHENIWVKGGAINALAHTGDAEALRLIEKFVHHPDLKRRLVQSFYGVRSLQAIPILGTALRDENWRIRYDAVWILGKIRHKDCVPYLIPMLYDISPTIARKAHKELNEINTSEARMAVDQWRQERYTRKQQYKRHKKV